MTDDIPSISILGVKIHRVDMAATLDLVRGYIASGKPHIIVTLDAAGVARAQDDPDYRDLVNSADLVTPDGAGVLWAARKLGTPLIERVSGVEIAREMCRIAAEDGFAIYFLGAAPGIAEQASANLAKQYPGLQIAGTHDGYFDSSRDREIAALVKSSGAKALMVAMGVPRQEKFIRDNMNELGVCVAIGVGGSFDVFSGKVKRAPEWWQRHGMEWLYRLMMDPRNKIAKVWSLRKFVALVLKERIGEKRRESSMARGRRLEK